MNPWGLSPSSFYPDEMQVGRKMDLMHGSHGSKALGPPRMQSVVSSALENRIPTDHKMAKGFDHPEYYFSHRNSNVSPGDLFLGAGAVSHSLPVAADQAFSDRINLNTESASYGINGDRINPMGAQSENSLFSSSLSDLFNKKLKLPSNNAPYGHFEVEGFESFEKPEVQIVNLPDDDDDLFSGVTDSLDELIRSNDGDDMEDLDLFSHVGGLEIGEDSSSWSNSVPSDLNSNNEHPFGGHPSRTLFVRNINSDVGDAELQLLFEQYGDIRNLYSACKHRGFVMISYYDIRAACNALKALQNKPFWNRELDIHFSIPKDNSSENDANQATVAVFNLNSSVSNDKLREIFSVYGEIKEIRDAPHRSQHKFVEFYDIRAAQSAHRSLKRRDIAGKQTMPEPGLSGGPNRLMRHLSSELEQEEFGARLPVPQHSSSYSAAGFSAGPVSVGGTSGSMGNGPIQRPRSINGGSVIGTFLDYNGVSSSVSDGLANQTIIPQPSHLRDQISFGSPNFRPHSLPEYHDGLVNGRSFGPHGHHHPWSSNSHHPQSQSIAWPNSPSFINSLPQQLPPHMLNPFHPLSNHHVGSAPSVNHPIWGRHHSYAGESLEMGISGTSPHHMEYAPHNMFPRTTSGNCVDVKTPKGVGIPQHHQRCMMFPPTGQMVPMMSSSFDSPNERSRSRRHDGRSSSSQTDSKKQFELDIDRILRGEDKRTTLMIKNIPNKYTSKMLLAAIDECHRGVYDFIYLPIDFKNKCNVGYAFINITEPSHIVPFYQTINGKKWEKFNSEKVATLAYARIQGRASLIAHFQNSSLMNEDKRCRPILFNTDGPNAGDQLPFPMGNNIRPRSGKIQSTTIGENNQEIPSNSGEDFTYVDSSSGSGKDSD